MKNSCQKPSYQYVETMSDDTEIDEESISTGPSETEADIYSDETESDYPVEGKVLTNYLC